jgi:hypothetical protein
MLVVEVGQLLAFTYGEFHWGSSDAHGKTTIGSLRSISGLSGTVPRRGPGDSLSRAISADGLRADYQGRGFS